MKTYNLVLMFQPGCNESIVLYQQLYGGGLWGEFAVIVGVINASLKVFRVGLFHFSQRSAMVTQGLNHY